MHPISVTLLLIGCATSLAAANFDISTLEREWPDLEKQETGTASVASKGSAAALQAASDSAPAKAPEAPKEGDSIEKYLLKDTDDFTIARDSDGRPILYSSVQEAGGLPLLYGVDGHGHLVQASSEHNFTLEAIPASPVEPVKASDLGAQFDSPRGAPQAPNPPTPEVQTSLSWPRQKPIIVEQAPWPAPINIHRHGHHHHSYESWPSEQKPVTSNAPQEAGPQSGPFSPVAAEPVQYDARPGDADMYMPNSYKGAASAQYEPLSAVPQNRPAQPVAAGPIRYAERPGDADMHMPGSFKGASSSEFPQQFGNTKFSPDGSQGPWESLRMTPRGPKAPWESARPESPEGPFYTEQQAFLGMNRAQPVQG